VNVHLHTKEAPFVCDHEGCGRSFPYTSRLIYHLQTFHAEHKAFVCPHEGCRYASARSSDLTRHWRTHSGKRPFVCRFGGCGRSFRSSGNLAIHRRLHTKKAPFVCCHEGCGRSFIQSGGLKSHWRTAHAKEKPFACSYEGCGKRFGQSGHRQEHLFTHQGTKRFACLQEGCNKDFSRRRDVRRHLLTHTRENPFVVRRDANTGLSVPSSIPGCQRLVRGEGQGGVPADGAEKQQLATPGGQVSFWFPVHTASFWPAVSAVALSPCVRQAAQPAVDRHNRSTRVQQPWLHSDTSLPGVSVARQRAPSLAGRLPPAEPCVSPRLERVSRGLVQPTPAGCLAVPDFVTLLTDNWPARSWQPAPCANAPAPDVSSSAIADEDRVFWQALMSAMASETGPCAGEPGL